MIRTPALFVDRDGTLIEDRGYLADPDGVQLLPGVVSTLAAVRRAGCRIVIVTNQSGLARGRISTVQLRAVHQRLTERFAEQSVSIDGIYVCPHHPEGNVARLRISCGCRKPAPGLLVQAAIELKLDLQRSLMVGDRWHDVDAGTRAGCRARLVLSGQGLDEYRYRAPQAARSEKEPAETLAGAAEPWLRSLGFEESEREAAVLKDLLRSGIESGPAKEAETP